MSIDLNVKPSEQKIKNDEQGGFDIVSKSSPLKISMSYKGECNF